MSTTLVPLNVKSNRSLTPPPSSNWSCETEPTGTLWSVRAPDQHFRQTPLPCTNDGPQGTLAYMLAASLKRGQAAGRNAFTGSRSGEVHEGGLERSDSSATRDRGPLEAEPSSSRHHQRTCERGSDEAGRSRGLAGRSAVTTITL